AAREGEVVGLIGPNGAGTITLFNVLSGFLTPEWGRASLHGRDLLGLPPHGRARLGLARTFQDLRLLPRLSVLDNVALFMLVDPGERLRDVLFRWRQTAREESACRRRAAAILEAVDLSGQANSSPGDLSYGQQKLLGLARSMAARASLFLLDEPVSGVAPGLMDRIVTLIRGLAVSGGAVILIEHDLASVARVCDRVIFMDAGVKVTEGTLDEVRGDPRVIERYLGG
ncbi:MAG: ATP-binding cassette domain-containing protein, partial [Deltaproteobacteria bacterium]|nr:ATP-binding cassette domain-containing protein [Deltaproteobacteria bacterium]